ncbi:MAG: pyruvate kinase, partial [Nitrospira sp.]|nr:pyruvate kinase [Nitrospira sp.]
FPSMLQPGHMVLLDDGHITLRILSYQKDRLICTVLAGGHITSRKGVNFPGLPLDLPGCTEKDLQDLELGIDLQVDYLALSFVRRPQDIHSVKSLLSKRGIHIPVIAKIERPEAVACLSEILEASDGVMIARGDLALELSPEDVPILQKRIIALANRMSKPVITATQMLESMTRHLVPTRAEASDVANAVLDGT